MHMTHQDFRKHLHQSTQERERERERVVSYFSDINLAGRRRMATEEMSVPDIAEFASNFAVMVRIQGPDPKGLKRRRHSFHLQHQSGETTLSASGLLLPTHSLSCPPPIIDHICTIQGHPGAVVVTTASVVEPFLTARQRNNSNQEFSPKLIPNARIDVLVKSGSTGDGLDAKPQWLQTGLLALVDVSASSVALLSLVGDHGSWDVGWSLPPLDDSSQSKAAVFQRQGNDKSAPLDEPGNLTLMTKLATRIAFLGVSADIKDALHLDISQPQKQGDFLLVMGSPFGILSPLHFLNSISIGTVANCCPSGSDISSLLMADIRCLPGMEGSPVFDRDARLTGILTRPLRQKGTCAEIQLIITWDAIVTAWSNEPKKDVRTSLEELVGNQVSSVQRESLRRNSYSRSPNYLPKNSDFYCLSQSPLEKAISSVVLLTVGDGVWASGIVLNSHGLILTNAHVLEPWRFGRSSLLGPRQKTTSVSVDHYVAIHKREGKNGQIEREVLFPEKFGFLNDTVDATHEPSSKDLNYKSYKKISVRMDHVEPRTWCDARVVYVSKGPLDVALLQLESVSNQICPITLKFSCPLKGSTVHVIGHGLISPRSDLQPSVFSGVLANVISMPRPLHLQESSILGKEKEYLPIMLQTTAVVHPGASGGAVVDSDGCMIGLITSNVIHGSGTILPHMNFSIPCAALEPIFKFSERQDLSILQVLDKRNESLSYVWAVTPSPKYEGPMERKNEDGRGSQFSKFISEKHTDLSPPVDQAPFIGEKLPSKM